MSCTVRSCALALLALAGLSAAEEVFDERHPRVPDQPLPITFTPWYCSECQKDGLIEGEAREVQMMRRDASALAEEIGIKRGWLVIESPTFRIFSNIDGAKTLHNDSPFAAADLQRLETIFPKFKPGAQGSYLSSHERAHLYHVRLERMVCWFRALTGNDAPNLGMGDRFQVFLIEDTKQYAAFSEKVMGRDFDPRNLAQRKHVPGEGNFYVFATAADQFKGKDQQLNNFTAHHVGHLIMNGHKDFVSDVWAWLEEGTAHFFMRRESPKYKFFCLQGVEPPRDFVRSNWEKTIRLMVYRKKEPSFGTWCDKIHASELTGDQHALAWSYVDWLSKTDPVRLAKLMDLSAVKGTTATQAVEEVFGVSPYALHDRWRDWVLEAYK